MVAAESVPAPSPCHVRFQRLHVVVVRGWVNFARKSNGLADLLAQYASKDGHGSAGFKWRFKCLEIQEFLVISSSRPCCRFEISKHSNSVQIGEDMVLSIGGFEDARVKIPSRPRAASSGHAFIGIRNYSGFSARVARYDTARQERVGGTLRVAVMAAHALRVGPRPRQVNRAGLDGIHRRVGRTNIKRDSGRCWGHGVTDGTLVLGADRHVGQR